MITSFLWRHLFTKHSLYEYYFCHYLQATNRIEMKKMNKLNKLMPSLGMWKTHVSFFHISSKFTQTFGLSVSKLLNAQCKKLLSMPLNQPPHSLRQPRLDLSPPDSPYPHDHLTSSASPSPLLSSTTPSFFHSSLKTFLFLKSYPP